MEEQNINTNLTIKPLTEKELDKAVKIILDDKESKRVKKALSLCATILDKIGYDFMKLRYLSLIESKPMYYAFPRKKVKKTKAL